MPLAEVKEILGPGSAPDETGLSGQARGAGSSQKVRQWLRWANGKTVIVAGFTGETSDAKACVLEYSGPIMVAGREGIGSKFQSGSGETAVAAAPEVPAIPGNDGIRPPGQPVRVTQPPQVAQPNPVPQFNPKVETDEDVTRNLAELKEANGNRRREAANRFAASSPDQPRRSEIAHALEGLLAEPDQSVRQSAAKALVVWATAEEAPALIKAVESPDGSVRGSALEALAALKDPRGAAAIAGRLTNGGDNETAVRLLTAMGAVAEPAVLPFLHHPDGGARERARKLLKAYETKDATLLDQTLVDLKSTDANRRSSAMHWLAELPPVDDRRKETAAALALVIVDANQGVRELAIKAFGAWATKDQMPTLLRLVGDTNSRTRQTAIEALGRLGDDKAAPAVAARLTDGGDRAQASIALKSMGPGAEGPVFNYLTHPDAAVRIEACRVLEVVGTKKCLSALSALTRDRNRDVALAANEAGKTILERLKKP
jgi:HEAT repeat protein